MMKVPPLSLVGMERLPLPLPFSPELLWRYNPLGPPTGSHHHSQAAAAAAAAAAAQQSPHPPTSAAVSAAAAAFTRAAAAAASSLASPIQHQLPFAYDIKTTIPIRLASDPRLWNRDDVSVFLQWCEREFDLPPFDMDRFQMNGKALCLLTKADLESRAPCSGDVIHNALQLLMASGDSPLTPHTPSSIRIPQIGVNGKGTTWSITDLQQYAAAQHQQGTTSVTLSPAPSLDGQAGSPQDHGNGQGNGQHLSSASSSGGSGGPPSDDSEYDSVGESPERSPPVQSMSPPPSHNNSANNHNVNGGHHHYQPHHHSNGNGNANGSASNANSNGNGAASVTAKSFSPGSKLTNGAAGTPEAGEYNNNGRLLWDFLQQLLNDPAQRYSNFIAWKNVDTGIFKIVDPPGLARLWGIQKNHLSMNYDKMSRALRYYYRVNILRKVQGERHCYQFLRNPGELKSIKNISMLRHQQNSPMSLSVKSEPINYGNENGNGNDYETSKYSLLNHHQQQQQQQQTSPVSLTVKSESAGYNGSAGDDYESKLSMLGHRHQSSPVSLTTKNSSNSPSSTSSTSSNGAPNGDSYGDKGDYDSMNGHPQDSPMSLTTKSSPSDHHHHPDNDTHESRGGHRPKPQLSPVSLTVKSEPSTAFINNDDEYEDVPTDLSMDTDRDRQSKDDD